MQRYFGEKRTPSGQVEPGATVSVFNTGTSDLAKLYLASENLDTPVTGIANPMTTDSNGRYAFAALDGIYDIRAQGFGGVEFTPRVTIAQTSTYPATIYADLANTSNVSLGDGLIGVKQPLTGSIARTQHSKNTEFVSVLDFGADNTGSTSSTAAILAAYAVSNKLYFPAGTYLVSTQVLLTTDVEIRGDSKFNTTIKTVSANIIFKSTSTFLTVSHLLFDGGSVATASNAITHGGGVNGTVFKMSHCTISNFGAHGIVLSDCIDCDFYDVKSTGGYGVDVPGTTTTRTSCGVYITPSAFGMTTTVTFKKCWFTSWKYGVYATNTISYSYIDCIFEYNFIGIVNYLDRGVAGFAGKIVRLLNCYFENNYNTLFGGAIFNNPATPTDDNTAIYGVLVDSIYQANAPSTITGYSRDAIAGTRVSTPRTMNQDPSVKDSVPSVFGFTKTVSFTVGANNSVTVISNDYHNAIFAGCRVGIATLICRADTYQGLFLTVFPATTASTDYFSVIATNTTASPITITSKQMNIMILGDDTPTAL